MRGVYVDWLVKILEEEDFSYIRISDEIFVKFFYPFLFMGLSPLWPSLDEFLNNMEWRIASNIAYGHGASGDRIAPPSALIDLVKKHDAFLRQIPHEEWSQTGYSTRIFHNCELIRAAAIRIEDMAPEDVPDLEGRHGSGS